MTLHKLIYKNFFGKYKILITETSDGKHPNNCTLIPAIEIHDSHIWINDNIVRKNHTENENLAKNTFFDYEELKSLLENVPLINYKQ